VNSDGTVPVQPSYDLTKWCTVPVLLDTGGKGFLDMGTITPLFINQISSAGLTVATAQYRNSNFLSEEFKDPAAVDVLSATYDNNAVARLRYDEAAAVLQYGGYAGLTAYDTTNSLALTYGNKDWTDLHAQGRQQIPNVACCKFEQWPKRTFMRYIKRIADQRLALAANTSVETKTATIIAAPAAA
jgi:hypothetical protein